MNIEVLLHPNTPEPIDEISTHLHLSLMNTYDTLPFPKWRMRLLRDVSPESVTLVPSNRKDKQPTDDIVVVEDDARINALIKHSLEMDGFEHIQTFLSGLKAELWLQKYCPKLVILDINLPGMSGLEVARSLRQAHESCQPRIIFLTAYPLSNDQEGQELADVYLMKPFNPLQLTQLIRRLLRTDKITSDT